MPSGQRTNLPPSFTNVARGQAARGHYPSPPTNAWSKSNAGGLLRTATSNARTAASNVMAGPTSVPQSGAAPIVLNPSNVPSPSFIGQAHRVNQSQAPANMSTMTHAPATHGPVAKLSNRHPEQYERGDIINLPFHEPNTDTRLGPSDPHLAHTCAGYVFSKRRYAIVLWVTSRDLFCVPIFSSHGGGITTKAHWLRDEYICLMNRGDLNFNNQGKYPPLEAVGGKWLPSAYVHITGGFSIECRCDISISARLSTMSTDELYEHWRYLTHSARKRSGPNDP